MYSLDCLAKEISKSFPYSHKTYNEIKFCLLELYSLSNRHQPNDLPDIPIETIKELAAPSNVVRLYNSGKIDEMMFDARYAVSYLNYSIGSVCRICRSVDKNPRNGSHYEFQHISDYFSFRQLYQTMPEKRQYGCEMKEQLCNSLCGKCFVFIFRRSEKEMKSGVKEWDSITISLSALIKAPKFRELIQSNSNTETNNYKSYWKKNA